MNTVLSVKATYCFFSEKLFLVSDISHINVSGYHHRRLCIYIYIYTLALLVGHTNIIILTTAPTSKRG